MQSLKDSITRYGAVVSHDDIAAVDSHTKAEAQVL